MSVVDKFLNAMRLNSDEEEDDYFDDEYDEEEDDYEPPKKPFRTKKQPKEEVRQEPKMTVVKDPKPSGKEQSANSKVTPMRSTRRSQGGSPMEVCVIKPTSVEDAREITETLLANRTIMLNLEGLDLDIAQRIIDFTSGSCFAVKGNLQKISNFIFVVTPSNVDISGDIQDVMAGFDVSSLHKDI